MLDLDPAAHLLISPPRNHVSPHTKLGSIYFNRFFHVDSRVFLFKKKYVLVCLMEFRHDILDMCPMMIILTSVSAVTV